MKLAINKGSLVYKPLYLLLVFMPLHYYVCELILPGISIDNLFRDALILMLCIFIFLSGKCRINKMGLIVIFNCFTLLIFAVISMLLYSYSNTFNILRTYLVPCLIFFVCTNIEITKNEFVKLHKLFIIELAIIGLYGFVQAFFLGDDFLVKIGYPSTNGILNTTSYYIGGFYGFQRVVGTFVSPNICGIILVMGLCTAMFCNIDIELKYKNIVIGCIVIGILGTFARAAIVGFVTAWIFIFVIYRKWKKINGKKFIMVIAFISLMIVLVVMIDTYFLNGLFISMLRSSFLGTVTGTDTSTIKHISDLIVPLNLVLEHPFGMGFGNNGPMALGYSSNVNTVESSIYLMMYETGILEGIFFFVPYIIVIIKTIKNRVYNYYVPACVCIAVFLTFLLLPNVQTYEVLFYSYMFIGFYFNPSVKSIFLENK